MQAWLVAVPWGRCPRKGCTRYQYERCFCCDSFKHMIFIQYTWKVHNIYIYIWYVQTYADVNFLLSGVCTYTICFSCCIIIFCFYLFSSWSNHKLPLELLEPVLWTIDCIFIFIFFIFSVFYFIRAKRVSNWYIPKKYSARVPVCTCARVFD